MLETLKTIYAILSRYGYEDEAAFIARLVSLHDSDGQAFLSAIQSNDMWGGAMSVADVDLKSSAFKGASPLEKKCDSKLLQNYLVDLSDQMRAAGIVSRRADSWAKTFQEWNEQKA